METNLRICCKETEGNAETPPILSFVSYTSKRASQGNLW